MPNALKRLRERFIRNHPRPTEYFVARVIAWTAVSIAVATGVGLVMAAVQLS